MVQSMLDHFGDAVAHHDKDLVFEFVESARAAKREHGHIRQNQNTPSPHLLHDRLPAVWVHACRDLLAVDILECDLKAVADGLDRVHLQRQLRHFLLVELSSLHFCHRSEVFARECLLKRRLTAKRLTPELFAPLLLVRFDDFHLRQALRHGCPRGPACTSGRLTLGVETFAEDLFSGWYFLLLDLVNFSDDGSHCAFTFLSDRDHGWLRERLGGARSLGASRCQAERVGPPFTQDFGRG